MADSIPLQLAETIQTAHIQRNPSPEHDLNPSTAASKREPVRLEPVFRDDSGIDESEDRDHTEDEEDEDEDDELYPSRITPRQRRPQHHLPPLPDLRFEQSYLSSIRNADTWWKIVLITVRDQVGPATQYSLVGGRW
jgi:hypothetical protein